MTFLLIPRHHTHIHSQQIRNVCTFLFRNSQKIGSTTEAHFKLHKQFCPSSHPLSKFADTKSRKCAICILEIAASPWGTLRGGQPRTSHHTAHTKGQGRLSIQMFLGVKDSYIPARCGPCLPVTHYLGGRGRKSVIWSTK